METSKWKAKTQLFWEGVHKKSLSKELSATKPKVILKPKDSNKQKINLI